MKTILKFLSEGNLIKFGYQDPGLSQVVELRREDWIEMGQPREIVVSVEAVGQFSLEQRQGPADLPQPGVPTMDLLEPEIQGINNLLNRRAREQKLRAAEREANPMIVVKPVE